MHELLGDVPTWAFTALRVFVVYGVLLVLLHAAGRRVLGQLSPFDLLTLLLLSNVVQNSMIGPDISLVGGLVGAAVLVGLNQLVGRTGWLRKGLEGDPVLLVHRGHVDKRLMQQEGVSDEELSAALREHGVHALSDVESAVLEMDGSVSVIPAGSQTKVHRIHRVRSLRRQR